MKIPLLKALLFFFIIPAVLTGISTEVRAEKNGLSTEHGKIFVAGCNAP
ncbi:hypothetical protein OR1_02355 [Geobacter sp. OR-1]|nr:hypothetical protein [Geobacter sp. OR-1]GAM10068.1 hypothetical protein OR1_02355 [Geobacter sp. OR-1]